MEAAKILNIIDWIFWVILALHIIYLLFFAWKGGMKKPYKKEYRKNSVNKRFAVFFPAYKEDSVILNSAREFLKQTYPHEYYDLIIISDKMQDSTNETLASMPLKLIVVTFEKSSKAKALTFAVENLNLSDYDYAVIMDADNVVDPDFLEKLNKELDSGVTALQAHRTAKNLNTSTAILDAVSEEINNTIFRAGHIKAGLSSALIGSGMAFTYNWFAENIKKATTAGEDKELEALLLKEGIYIDYIEDLYVYDEKTAREDNFGNQRRRWLAAQFGSLASGLKDLPGALFRGNIDYADKLFQWMMLPRVMVIGLTFIFAIVITILNPIGSIKWWIIFWLLILAMAMAIPDRLATKEFYRALRRAPFLAFRMFGSIFKLKGANKNFIHTAHGEDKIKE